MRKKKNQTHYSFSRDGRRYYGSYDTVEAAIKGVLADGDAKPEQFFIGICKPPPSPESYWDAADWLEHVSCQDDYCEGDGWDISTKKQRAELNEAVQGVMSEWLDAYNLRPEFYTVYNSAKYTVNPDGSYIQIEPFDEV